MLADERAEEGRRPDALLPHATRRTASPRRSSATRRRAGRAPGSSVGERVPDRLERQPRHDLRQARRPAEGHDDHGQQPRPEHPAGRAAARRDGCLQGKCGAAVVLNPKTGAVYVMASSPGYNPNLIESSAGYARILATRRAPARRVGVAAPQPRDAGALPAGLDLQDGHRRRRARRPAMYTPDSSFYDPGYCTEYGKQVYNALDQNGPERSATSTSIEAYQHSINAVFCNIGKKLGAKAILDKAKKFGFYSTPPLETAVRARSPRAGSTTSRSTSCSTTPRLGRPGPPRVRPGEPARDAAADGAGRSRRSRTTAR